MESRVTSIEASKLIETMVSKVKPSSSVLEIGPGIRPFELTFTPLLRVFVEPSAEYVELLEKQTSKTTGKIIVRMDALSFLHSLTDKSFETIICLDVIEHLDKVAGQTLIHEMLRVSSKQVVVFTPLGYMPQHMPVSGVDPWGLSEVELQKHLSGWLPEDFPSHFEVYVAKDFHFQPDGKAYGAIFATSDLSAISKSLDFSRLTPLLVNPRITQLEKDPFLFHALLPTIISGKEFVNFGKLVSGIQATRNYFGITASSGKISRYQNLKFRTSRYQIFNTLIVFISIFPLQFSHRREIKAFGFSKFQRFILAGFTFSKFDDFQLPLHMFIKTQIRISRLLALWRGN